MNSASETLHARTVEYMAKHKLADNLANYIAAMRAAVHDDPELGRQYTEAWRPPEVARGPRTTITQLGRDQSQQPSRVTSKPSEANRLVSEIVDLTTRIHMSKKGLTDYAAAMREMLRQPENRKLAEQYAWGVR